MAIASDYFCSSFCDREKPLSFIYFLWNVFLRINLKITNARRHCYDNAATMTVKKSSVTTQIKSLN